MIKNVDNGIIFIGIFPTLYNNKDGMIRRIEEVDKYFNEIQRCYLNINFFGIKKEKNFQSELIEYINYNFFIDFFKIFKLINRCKYVYIHSLLNYARVFPFLKHKNTIIVDLHGVVVEEMNFNGKKTKAFLLNILEYFMFRKLKIAISVTRKMENFYLEKYIFFKEKKRIVLPILSKNNEYQNTKWENPISKINLERIDNKVVFIYSGNLQKWQNVDMMLKKISENNSINYIHIFLTGEPEKMRNKIIKYSLSNYILDSIAPQQLKYYYEKSHYGFVLRENHILNQVANPTKLSEYLEYGIIPIVLEENIGDYKDYDYEFLKISEFSNNLKAKKSFNNVKIIERIKRISEEVNIKDLIFDGSEI